MAGEKGPEKQAAVVKQTPGEKRGEQVKTAVDRVKKIPGGTEKMKAAGGEAASKMRKVAPLPDKSPRKVEGNRSLEKGLKPGGDSLENKVGPNKSTESKPVGPEHERTLASANLEKATKAATEARETADKTQTQVAESYDAVQVVKETLKGASGKDKEKAEKALKEAETKLFKDQADLVEARKDSTKKAKEELEAAEKAEKVAEEGEKEAAQKRVAEAKKKYEEALKAELISSPELIDSLKQVEEALKVQLEKDPDNPELKEQLQEMQGQIEQASAGGAPSHLGNLRTENPLSQEELRNLEGSCGTEALIGAGDKYVGKGIKWVLGAGHPPSKDIPPPYPKALDCSAFVSACLRDNGIKISRTSRGFFADSNAVPCSSLSGEPPKMNGEALPPVKKTDDSKEGGTSSADLSTEKGEKSAPTDQKEPGAGGKWAGCLLFKDKPSTHVAIVTGPPVNGQIPTLESASSKGGPVRTMRPMRDPWSIGRPPYIT